jgi:hypothetical protein
VDMWILTHAMQRLECIQLTITIRWDVMPCRLVGRSQLSEEAATYILMAEK